MKAHQLLPMLIAASLAIWMAAPAAAQSPTPQPDAEATPEAAPKCEATPNASLIAIPAINLTTVPTITSTKGVTPTAVPAAQTELTATVVSTAQILREGPDNKYPRLSHRFKRGDVVNVIGRGDDCTWLKVKFAVTDASDQAETIIGWVRNTRNVIRPQRACKDVDLPRGSYRPLSQLEYRATKGGLGRLIIQNNDTADAILTMTALTDTSTSLLEVRVRANEQFTVTGIRDGMYCVFVELLEYAATEDDELTYWVRDASLFDDPLKYVTTRSQYTFWTVTLNAANEKEPAATTPVRVWDVPRR